MYPVRLNQPISSHRSRVRAVLVKMKVLAILLVAVVAGVMAGKIADEMMAVRETCKTNIGATEEDLKDLEANHEVNSDISKKMVTCMFKDLKVMVNNKFSKEGAVNMVRSIIGAHPGAEEKIKMAESIATACEAELASKEATEDEMAKMIFECFKKEMNERKITE